MADIFNKYAQKGNQMVNELATELGIPEDKETAFRILRAVLRALRNQLSIEESFQLLAQLPMSIKGIYVEQWNISKSESHARNVHDFVAAVRHQDRPMGRHDLMTAKDGINAVMAVFKILRAHVSAGEIKDIISVLPTPLKDLWKVKS
ncbi:DUF2267 domain-containing protein [Fulvivirgaceae bacterium BMA12]|uniref:DUF2267 domain-containing protein n=1 Tax=Agaribacillus aureus TaxID=3051825 RepID=A0ABT8LJ22_9BACT|nr:DUF2267 domain-containing protein [Fulvivirgaceae bacterium BMA12]